MGILIVIVAVLFGLGAFGIEMLGYASREHIGTCWNLIAALFVSGWGVGMLQWLAVVHQSLFEPYLGSFRLMRELRQLVMEQLYSGTPSTSAAALSVERSAREPCGSRWFRANLAMTASGLFLCGAFATPRFVQEKADSFIPSSPAQYFDETPKIDAVLRVSPQAGVALSPLWYPSQGVLALPCLAPSYCRGGIAWLRLDDDLTYWQPLSCRAFNDLDAGIGSGGGYPTCYIFQSGR